MSTTTIDVSPVDFVKSLTPEVKDSIFLELVREAIAESGGQSMLPVVGANGESLGFLVSSELAKQRFASVLPELDAAYRARTQRALADLSRTFDISEVLNED